ncbi:NINE protein [Kordiimonas sp.]|uniref:NINE protein n=1 Tax=Kordiimonas sp. TaxID=1970157 RepID=UPI003A93EB7C
MIDQAIAWIEANADLLGGIGTLSALTMFIITHARNIVLRRAAAKNSVGDGAITVSSAGAYDAAAPSPEYGGKVAIAVLPFGELGTVPDHFADGLMEDLITDLQALGFATPAKRSTRSLAASSTAPHQIARDLGTPYVLEGSIRIQDDRYRIAVELVDRTAATVWSERFNFAGDDLMAMQEAMAQKIAHGIAEQLSPERDSNPVGRATSAAAASTSPASGYRTQSDMLRAYRSPKSRLVALLLCLLLGWFGVHRFYVGRWITGTLYALTGGLFAIGWVLDLLLILFGSMADSRGRPIRAWRPDPPLND